MKVPCVECLLVPVCRHKTYSQLARDCRMMGLFVSIGYADCIVLRDGIDAKESAKPYRLEISKVISPTKWQVDGHGRFTEVEKWEGR